MTTIALKARWVLPIDTPPIDGGVVTIAGGRIAAVDSAAEPGAKLRDLGDVVLMPGLVNAHTHLEFSDLSSPLGRPGMPLPEWIRSVIATRKQKSDAGAAIEAGLRESLSAGVTSIGEIATAVPAMHADGNLPSPLVFQEVIGFSAARVDSVFSELGERLRRSSSSQALGISPHAPYTVHPDLLARLVGLASEQQLPVAMHLAESPEELDLLQNNAGPFRELLEERSMWDGQIFASGKSPLDYLRALAEAPRSLVIHGNYLAQQEIDFVAQQDRMSIVFCPRTHAFFGHTEYPLPAMLKSGARVAFGTDSRASNPDLNLLSELRHVANTFSMIEPERIVRMGTLSGAEALGIDAAVGSLAVGKVANLTAIACDSNEVDPYAAVIGSEREPITTWLGGSSGNGAEALA